MDCDIPDDKSTYIEWDCTPSKNKVTLQTTGLLSAFKDFRGDCAKMLK